MNTVSPETRNRNVVTLILLILFACGLCAYVLLSMRVHNQRQQQDEGAHMTVPGTTLRAQSRLSFAV